MKLRGNDTVVAAEVVNPEEEEESTVEPVTETSSDQIEDNT
jgi:hypothetical protein